MKRLYAKLAFSACLLWLGLANPLLAQPNDAFIVDCNNLTYSQDFNSITPTDNNCSSPGNITWTDDGTIENWFTGTLSGTARFFASDGTCSPFQTGGRYSAGADGQSDRALGSLNSGSNESVFGMKLHNNTGRAITEITVTYTGEQWRRGSNSSGDQDFLVFQYSTDATAVDDGAATWNNEGNLDFGTPNTGAPNDQGLDGNDAANQTNITFTITGLSIPDDQSFWIRWNNFDVGGADDLLAIDDLSLEFATAPGTPGTVTIGPSQTACEGSELLAELTGNDGAVLRWETSGDNFVSDILEVNTSDQTFPLPNIASDRCVRVVTDGCGAELLSNEACYTVEAAPAAGTIMTLAATPVCAGANSITMTLSGNEAAVLRWEVSTDDFAADVQTIANTAGETQLSQTNIVTTSFYRVVVDGGTCGEIESASVEIEVESSCAPGSIAGAATGVCPGNNSTNLTLSGGDCSTVLRWETSTNDFSSVQTVTNTTNSFTLENINADTDVRAVYDAGACGEINTDAVEVTVAATGSGGTLSGAPASPVCAGDNEVTLALSGHTGNILEWQVSDGASAFQSATPASTDDNYTFEDLTETTQVRVLTDDGSCPGAQLQSNVVEIAVNPTADGGTISGAPVSPVTSGSNSTTLTLLGNTGAVLRWESSTDNFNSDIQAINETSTSLTLTDLVETTQYRAVIDGQNCPGAEAFSTAAEIQVSAQAAPAPPITIDCDNLTYTQDFNTLASAPTTCASDDTLQWTNGTNLSGWEAEETSTTEFRYKVGAGDCSTGALYSFGPDNEADRALGAIYTGGNQPFFGAVFVNNTGDDITEIDVAYTGEQWRKGTTTDTDALFFEYSTDATSVDDPAATWNIVSALQFDTPNTGAATGPLDGNDAANRNAESATIALPTALPDAGVVYMRWTSTNVSDQDDGLAVDDLSVTFTASACDQPVDAIIVDCNNLTYSEDFNSLTPTTNQCTPDASATWTDGVTLAGWSAAETSGNTFRYYGGDGSCGTGSLYSFGADGATERALGAQESGSNETVFGVQFTNSTGADISTIDVSYIGEQWRKGNNTGDALIFEYSTDATSVDDGAATWTPEANLRFDTPNSGASSGALDGNATANKTAVSGTITLGTPLADGQSIFFRWNFDNPSGSDDGLGVDDLNVTFNVPSGGDPGVAGNSATVCIGSDVVLSLSGNSGNVLRWETATSSDFSTGLTTIDNTTNFITLTNLQTTTYARAVTQGTGGACGGELFSTSATLTAQDCSTANDAEIIDIRPDFYSTCFNSVTSILGRNTDFTAPGVRVFLSESPDAKVNETEATANVFAFAPTLMMFRIPQTLATGTYFVLVEGAGTQTNPATNWPKPIEVRVVNPADCDDAILLDVSRDTIDACAEEPVELEGFQTTFSQNTGVFFSDNATDISDPNRQAEDVNALGNNALTFVAPATIDPGDYFIIVRDGGTQGSSSLNFPLPLQIHIEKDGECPDPELTSVTQDSINTCDGDTVEVQGARTTFLDLTDVELKTSESSTESFPVENLNIIDNRNLTFTVPNSVPTGAYLVIVNDGGTQATNGVDYPSPLEIKVSSPTCPGPELVSVSPNPADLCEDPLITVTGERTLFSQATKVWLSDSDTDLVNPREPRNTIADSDTQIRFFLPAGITPGTYYIIVENGGTQPENGRNFPVPIEIEVVASCEGSKLTFASPRVINACEQRTIVVYGDDATTFNSATAVWLSPSPNAVSSNAVEVENLNVLTDRVMLFTAPTDIPVGRYYVLAEGGGTQASSSLNWPEPLDILIEANCETSCDAPAPAATQATENTATLEWPAVPGAVGYEIQFKPVADPNFSAVIPVSVNRATIGGLDPGTDYVVVVRTICEGNVASQAVFANFSTEDDAEPTCATPQNVAVAPTDVNATSARVTWTAVQGAQSYEIRYRALGENSFSSFFAGGNSTSALVGGLTPDTPYEVSVKAVCSDELESEFSDEEIFRTSIDGGCVAPAGLPQVVALSPTSVEVTWNAVSANQGYNIQWKLDGPNNSWRSRVVSTNSAVITGLIPDETYLFIVRTRCGPGEYSNFTNIAFFPEENQPDPCPPVFNMTVGQVEDDRARINWTPVAEAVSYTVIYRIAGEQTPMQATTTETTLLLTDLAPDTDYVVSVLTNCADVSSQSAPEAAFRTLPGCPAPDAVQFRNVLDTQAEVFWNPVDEADGYAISFRLAGQTNWTNEIGRVSTTYPFSPLEPNTTYEARVRTICPNDETSGYVFGTVTTPGANACLAPDDIDLDVLQNGDLQVSWTATFNPIRYELQYRISGASNWISRQTSQTSDVLRDLAPNTAYEIRVRAVCGLNSFSDWATTTWDPAAGLCPAPVNVRATQLNGATYRITWSGSSQANTYTVRYRPVSSGVFTTVPATANASVTITGLAPQTTYSVEVRADCGTRLSDVGIATFTTGGGTTGGCTDVTNLVVDRRRSNNTQTPEDFAIVSWDAGGPAGTQYNIAYRNLTISGPFVTDITTATNYTLTGLDVNATYLVQVRRTCGNTVTNWVSVVSSPLLNARAAAEAQPAIGGLRVYPNPNNGAFNVSFDLEEAAGVKLRARDVAGRVVLEETFRAQAGEHTQPVSLERAASGVYLVELETGEARRVVKVIVN